MHSPRAHRSLRAAGTILLLAITLVARAQPSAEAAVPASGVNTLAAIPTPVVSDTISGFELYQNGVFWWNTLGAVGCPGGEFSNLASIKVRGILNGRTRTLENARCPILQDSGGNVVRDSQYIYYFQSKQLVRKTVSVFADTPPTPLTQAPPLPGSLSSSESLAIDTAGRLYWSTHTGGVLTIWRMKSDNSEAPAVFVSFNSPNNVTGHMLAYSFRPTSFSPIVEGIAFMDTAGNLWRYNNNGFAPLLLGSDVREFWVRVSQVAQTNTSLATFYVAQGNGLFRITNTASSTQIYTPIGNGITTIDGVTSDDQNIYLVESIYDNCPGQFCPDPINRTLYRRALSAADNAPWDLFVEQGGGVNLRSDGQFIYFSTGNALKKVPTDAPAIQIDIEALDLEVTQAIQDLQEGFDLMAGHPTMVRGYARVATNTNPDAYGYVVNATLTGKLNGQMLPDGPLHPLKNVLVYNPSKQTMRNDATLTFLFVLPESWVQDKLPIVPDQLQLSMTVNATGDTPENVGANPQANNTVSATALVRHSTSPCLMMIPVRADHLPVVGQNPPNLPQKVARARGLMPVKGFRVFTNYTSNDLEDNWILSKDGDGYDMDNDTADHDDDSDDGALGDLDDLDAWSSEWQNCSDLHWLGMLPPNDPAWWGGLSHRNDNVLLVKFGGGGGGTIAHELGHNYGRRHINCGTFPPGQDNFDFTLYDPCNLYFTNMPLETTYYGFNFLDLNDIKVMNPGEHADIMSYDNSHSKWPGYVYWLQLMHDIPNFDNGAPLQLAATPSAGDLLYAGGELNLDANTASFNTVYRVPDGVAPAAKVAQSLQTQGATTQAGSAIQPQHEDSSAVIRQLDASDITLSETLVVTKESTLHSGGQHHYGFSQYIPFDPQTKKVQLVHDNVVLAERVASANAPTLTLAPPVLDDAAGTIKVNWTAADSDFDSLHAMILYSNDDGAHWLPLDKNVTGLEATFNTRGLAGGTNARMRLIVDDGFNTAIATSSPFSINKHAPTPIIDGVIEQQRLPYSSTTTLDGLALDADQGSLDSEALTWSLSGPTSRNYSGSQILLAGLAPGQYTLTLSATDSDGMAGTTSRHFEVLPVPVPDGSAPTLNGSCSDTAYANAIVVPLDANGAQASLVHSGGTLYACFSNLTVGTASATNVVGIRVDANNSKDAGAQIDDRGFFVDQDGIPFQTVGNGSGMPETTSPASGYTATVAYHTTGWSAEVSIADALVGGWGHAASILLQHNIASHTANANNWPSGGIYNQPNTWATALFGIAPALDNRAPVADAGSDQTQALSKSTIIALDSSASYDADADTITPTWTQVAGPSVTLTEPTTSTIRFIASPVSAPTVLRFQLTVSDGTAMSSPDEVIITLLPPKPSMTRQKVYLPVVRR